MKRRNFLKSVSTGVIMTATGFMPLSALNSEQWTKLTILHTNDVHSRIDPFPMDGGKYQGLGGVARRAALIKKIRKQSKNVLLLDAGDMFQGTPYFNYFGGEIEFRAMSSMAYDAATIGNHDFDAGIDGLKKQLIHASFPLIISNYDFSSTPMESRTNEYRIIKKDGLKIGITGVGIELDGLVPDYLTQGTKYLDPIHCANRVAKFLKEEENCDYVICLSHLGYAYDDETPSDKTLAAGSKNIDLIIGGHTHTFLHEPTLIKNKVGTDVLIHQVGFAGIWLGRIEVFFEKSRKKQCFNCQNIQIM